MRSSRHCSASAVGARDRHGRVEVARERTHRSLLRASTSRLLVIVGVLLVFGTVDGPVGDLGHGRRPRGCSSGTCSGIVIGIVLMVVAWAIDYRKLQAWIGPLLVLDAFLILSPRIPGLGARCKGRDLWLQIGGFRLFQPSEPAKLLIIVVMAAVIAEFKGRIERPATSPKSSASAASRSGSSCCSPTWEPASCSSPSPWACCSSGG